ncbi:hypothetical protein [Pectobacterium cacticida]|uniref:hypothetical protein n=1 Tax=Pectobacterium cacticida TaxID=69221 RepID=UPI0039886C76
MRSSTIIDIIFNPHSNMINVDYHKNTPIDNIDVVRTDNPIQAPVSGYSQP